MAPQILRLSTEDNRFIPIPGTPVIFEKVEHLNNDLTDQINQKSNKALFDTLKDVLSRTLRTAKLPILRISILNSSMKQ